MAMAMASVFLLLFLVLVLSPLVFAKDINVGGNSGWTNGFDYSTWASSQKFNVGDKLVFTYGFTHSLDEVSKDDYDNCNTGNSINSYSASPASITLTKAGPMYFTCSSHCSQGQKLAINVASTSTTPGGSPPSPPSDTTPSPPSETTPSTPGSSTTPDSPPSRTSSTTAPPTPTGGATSIFGGFSHLMVVVLIALFVFMA